MIQVRAGTYRGKQGFKIGGTDWLGRRVRVFVRTKDTAEVWRAYLKSGDDGMSIAAYAAMRREG